jgi:hypothetical protein
VRAVPKVLGIAERRAGLRGKVEELNPKGAEGRPQPGRLGALELAVQRPASENGATDRQHPQSPAVERIVSPA